MITDSHKYLGVGCGLLLGDAHCAPYEGGTLERGLWWLIGSTKGRRRYTDDSQMAFDLGNHLLSARRINQQVLLNDFAHSYRWSRGYGPSTVAVLREAKKGRDWHSAATRRYADGSYGNGAAMRVPIVSVFLHGRASTDELLSWVRLSAEVTHPNQRAIDGAIAIAICVCNALDNLDTAANVESVVQSVQTSEMKERMGIVSKWLASEAAPSARQAKMELGAGTAAIESCPVAIYIALKCADRPFQDLIHNAIKDGGDTDTIGAMAGSIWGAYNSDVAMPADLIESTEGVDLMRHMIVRLRASNKAIKRTR